MTTKSRVFLSAFLLLGYMALIFFMSSRPLLPLFRLDISNIDKLYHTVAYAVLGFLAANLAYQCKAPLFWSAYVGTFLGSLYGISDEFHQSFVPGRDASLGDMIADMVGSLLGAVAFCLFVLWKRPKPSQSTPKLSPASQPSQPSPKPAPSPSSTRSPLLLAFLGLSLFLGACQHSQPASRPASDPRAATSGNKGQTASSLPASRTPEGREASDPALGSASSSRPEPPPPPPTATFAGVFAPYLPETSFSELTQALQDGRCDIAEDEAKKIKKEDHLARRAALFRVGLCWRDKAETPKAREIFVILEKDIPILSDYLKMWQAAALEKEGAEAEAIKLYLAIPKTSRMFGLARIQAAALLWKAGQAKEVLAAFEGTNLLEKQPSAWWLATLANARLKGQASKKAMIAWLKKLLVEAPHTPEAAKAEAWIKERSPAFALSPLESVLRGAVYNRFFAYKKALDTLDAVPMPPKPDKLFLCRLLYHRGFAWFRLRKYGQAIPLLRQATEKCKGLKEDEPKALFFFAQAFRRIGRSSAGIAPFRLLIKRYPEHFFADDALFEIAEVFDNPSQADKARQTYQEVVEKFPKGDMVVISLWRIAWQDYRQKRWDDAIQHFQKLASGYPRSPEAPASLYFAARALQEKAGKLDASGAEDAYKALLDRHPMHYYSFLALERLAQLRKTPWHLSPAEAPIAARLTSSAFKYPSALPAVAKEGSSSPILPWGPRRPQAPKSEDLPALFLADAPFLQHPAYLKGLEFFRLGLPQMAATEWQRLISCEVFPPPNPKPPVWQCGLHGDKGAVVLGLLFHLVRRFSLADRTFRRRGIIEGLLPFHPKTAPIWYLAYPRPFEEPAYRLSKKNRLDPALAYAIMREESTFNPFTQSWSNAYGLMQLIMPTAIQTARSALPGQTITPERLYDPGVNIALGTRYLRILLHQFKEKYPLAISSYNAGPAWTLRWLKRYGDLPFDEWVEMISIKQTRDYVKRVTQSYAIYRFLYGFLDETPRPMLPLMPWWIPSQYKTSPLP